MKSEAEILDRLNYIVRRMKEIQIHEGYAILVQEMFFDTEYAQLKAEAKTLLWVLKGG